MTDELLKGMCAQVANMAKTEIRYRHCLNGILATYFEGQGLHRMRKVEKLVEEKVGPDWLNFGGAKDIIFGILCLGANVIPPDAIVISTVINDYRRLPAFDALPPDEQKRVWDAPVWPPPPQYFQAHDALMVVAQSPERVCTYSQKLLGDLLIGEPDILLFPQAEWNGRLKMYGVEPPSEIVETFAKMQAEAGGK